MSLEQKYLTEITKSNIDKAFADVWDAVSEIVPTARKQGIDVKITELVPLRKELDKIEKKIKKRYSKAMKGILRQELPM